MSEQLNLIPTWADGPLCCFDTETTGADPEEARIVSASVGINTVKTWLVNPGIPIPEDATAVHGITTERAVAEGVPTVVAAEDIGDALAYAWSSGVPVVAFNATYDLTVLAREMARCGLTMPHVGAVLDPFVIDRELDRYRKGKRTLSATCEHYGVALEGAHDATVDALATVELARVLARRFPQIAAMGPNELHAKQVVWHRERQDDFARYLLSKGKDASDVHRDWPIRSAKDEERSTA